MWSLVALNRRFWIGNRAIQNRAIRIVRFQSRCKHWEDAIRMAIPNRFSAILLSCDSTHFFASRCGISGDSRPAIPGIVRFAIRDSVPLRCGASAKTRSPKIQNMLLGKLYVLLCFYFKLLRESPAGKELNEHKREQCLETPSWT